MDEKRTNKEDDLTSFSSLAGKYMQQGSDDVNSVSKDEKINSDSTENSSSAVKSDATVQFSLNDYEQKEKISVADSDKVNNSEYDNNNDITTVIKAIKEEKAPVAAVPETAEKEKKKDKKKKDKHKKGKGNKLANFDVTKFSKRTYIFFGTVIALSVLLSIYAVFCVNDILAIGKKDSIVSITMEETEVSSMNKTIDMLHDNKLVSCPTFCKLFMQLRNAMADGGFEAPYSLGTFELNAKMGVEGMLIALQGETKQNETVELTFPEGFTVNQIIARLTSDANNVCDESALRKELESAEYNLDIISDAKSSEEVPFKFEGYLFPSSYEFYVGENPSSVIKRFLDAMDTHFPQEYRDKAKEMGYSVREILTLASIIQKEAANTKQMAVISAILHNRLKSNEMPFLQCDSTGDYISNSIGPNLTANSKHTSDYYMLQYDTYVLAGLPAGPICNPGDDAIFAALNPDAKSSKLLYFCHDRRGNMYTARTYEQHRVNVAKYVGR